MKTVLLDCDGVVASFVGHCLRHLREVGGPDLADADWVRYDMFDTFPDDSREALFGRIMSPGFCATIPAFEGAVGFARALIDTTDLYVVTSPWNSPFWHHERLGWLYQTLGVQGRRVIFASNKTLVRGDCLIDDRAEHVADWAKAHPGGTGILVDRPYNQDVELPANAVRTHSYTEILDIVGGL